jgi:hypothetical protein
MSKKYYDIIGFRFERKQNKKNILPENIKRDSYDLIPYSKDIITALKYTHNSDYIKITDSGMMVGNYKKISHFNRQFMLNNKELLLGTHNIVIKKLYEYISENIKWEKISSITHSNNYVYDFSLNDNDDEWCHSVLFNNVLGSNTPTGMNHFYDYWVGATRTDGNANNFYPIKAHWWDRPDRDEEWREETLKTFNNDIKRFNQEFNCVKGDTVVKVYDSKIKMYTDIKMSKIYANCLEMDTMYTVRSNYIYQILTDEGYKQFNGIRKSLVKNKLLTIVFDDDSHISITHEHRFVVDCVEVFAKDLNVGFKLQSSDGYKSIKSIDSCGDDYVYDIIDVGSSNNTYYTNDILSHNCQFLGSSNTLIDAEILERILPKEPVEYKWNGVFKVFERPIDNVTYIMGVDTGKGTGNDYSVVQVLKIINEKDIKQVAVYRDNEIDPHDYAQVCIGISKYYNSCYMMIENNGIGDMLAGTIWYEYEYSNIVNTDSKGLGTRSTNKSKLEANLLLKRYMDEKYLELVDRDTVSELSQYIEVTPNVYRAESSSTHDDCVTALLWGLYFIQTSFFDGEGYEAKEIDEQYDLSDGGPIMFFPDVDYNDY